MSYFLSPLIRQRFFDDATGAPLAGGQLFTYAAGTTTPQSTYSNSTGTVNANPVVLNSHGYADVWLDPSLVYKFVLQDANSNTLWTVDNVNFPVVVTAWSSTISYSMGAIVQDASGYGLFYVSLTNNNLNNALATSVSNWRRLGGNNRTVSTNTTILATDELLRSNSTSGNLTHTLPACSTTSIGTRIKIKDVGTGGNTTSVKGNGTDNIDGANTYANVLHQYDAIEVQNSGSTWDVL